jgi:hypothetical protein
MEMLHVTRGIYNSMEKNSFLWKLKVAELFMKFPAFNESKDLLPYSQNSDTVSCPEPDESSPHPPAIFVYDAFQYAGIVQPGETAIARQPLRKQTITPEPSLSIAHTQEWRND